MTTVTSSLAISESAKTTATTATKTNMDYDSFLKLFMAQMRNQDPTKPNDPTETLSQLASFSNVEQSIRLNDKLDSLLTASNATLASSLIGKVVSNLDGSISGIAKAVEVTTGGLAATLVDGQILRLEKGYRVGAA
jgi:flagellar basal-body rod modification protein FlgD